MARTRRIKHVAAGAAEYHIMSRTNDRRYLFVDGAIKTALADALRRAAAFSGVRLRAYTIMGNHFHVAVRVTRSDAPVPEAELVRRVGILKGARAAAILAERWASLHASGYEAQLADEQERLRRRMNDISGFVKTFKELFDRLYKRDREYCGSIWSGRFKSTLVEDGRYLAVCVKYILHNPIRAGLVRRVEDYPWSWCEDGAETEVMLGSVPGEWCGARHAQIGDGKVLGSEGYVRRMSCAFGWCFRSRRVAVHGLVGLSPDAGWSTHGWRLARRDAAQAMVGARGGV